MMVFTAPKRNLLGFEAGASARAGIVEANGAGTRSQIID